MMEFINQFLYGYYPYVALTVFFIGSIMRFEHSQYSWRSGSSQLLRRKQLMIGSVLFHVGILIIFFGHLVGLLTPIWVFDALGISHGDKQVLAIVAGGLAGSMCFLGMILLIHRRLFDPRIRATSSFVDTAILLMIFAQLCLGLLSILVSINHLDGHEMVRFMEWAQRILTFRDGAALLIRDANPIFKAHILLGLTIFLVFPFTRLVHMLSAPIWYLNRRGYQIVRTRKQQSGNQSTTPAE